MTRSLLLIGANGQLGQLLRTALGTFADVTALDVPDVDLSRPESLREAIRATSPDVIVNAGAYTAVDRAESEPLLAHAINGAGPRVLAEEAAARNAVLVHYSTDYVFDGTKSGAYRETDEPSPRSVYGRTKRIGEIAVLEAPKGIVLRTSWVISGHGHNFVRTMLRLAHERDGLRVVNDQFGAPTSAQLLADTTATVLQRLAAGETRWGLYHLVAEGETTWFGLTRHVVERARARGYPIRVTPEAIVPITTAEYPTPAERPTNSRLDTTKLRTTFGIDLPDWREGADAAVDEFISGGGS
jgi:dTDP-4-dehydrorhamnose reductase